MPVVADRVKESTTGTGVGSLTLSGASTGYQSFASAVGVGPTFPYCVASSGGPEWEVGLGHLSAVSVLVRDTVLASSNSGSLVSFSSGTKDVFLTSPGSLLSPAPVTLAFAAAVSPVSLGNVTYRCTLTNAMTLNTPTGGSDGDKVRLWLVASGADRVLTINAAFHIPASSAFASPVTITSGKKAKVLLEYDATLNGGQWELTSFINGF